MMCIIIAIDHQVVLHWDLEPEVRLKVEVLVMSLGKIRP
jgi:hypothetical protein